MAEMNETPNGNRIHIAIFGLRNAGKSTLANRLLGQPLSIVSPEAGTTTDPVSKTMELLPLGPVKVTDTAGLDDVGELGELRVKKSLDVLRSTDIAIWVGDGYEDWRDRFQVPVIQVERDIAIDELKRKLIALNKGADRMPGLLEGLVEGVDVVVCICPIDESAPKGRLILPQQQVIRECLDRHLKVWVMQPDELDGISAAGKLFVTDSQAFAKVRELLPIGARLTSFSILFARQKGDIAAFKAGLEAVRSLKDGDAVLIAEACTHHRQCNDIGSVKIPKALAKLSGCAGLKFLFSSGLSLNTHLGDDIKLIVHCGGCMITRCEMLSRIAFAKSHQIPIVNYGILLAAAAGIITMECDGKSNMANT